MIKNKISILLIAALLGGKVAAQEKPGSLTLNLQEAVDYAMENNKNLINAKQELIKSEKSIWEIVSQGLPQIDATLDYMTYFGYEMEFAFGMGGDVSFTDEQLLDAQNTTLAEFSGIPAYGIAATTPQDIYNYNAGSYYSQILQESLPPSVIQMTDQLTAKLQLGWLVFSGQYLVGIQTAKLGKVISEQALDNTVIDTKEAVVTAYFATLIAESSMDMVELNLENLKEMLKQTKKMYEAGMAEQLDVDQFSVTVNQLENTRKMMERNLLISYNILRFTLGVPADTEINLTDNLGGLFEDMEAASLLLSDFTLEQHKTYQILTTQAEINEKLLTMEKWNFGPTISAFYNYNLKLMTTGFDMTPKHLAGFNLSMPIMSSGMRSAKVAQAKINYEISERNKEILGDQLDMQYNQLKYNLQSSLESFTSQKENVEVAERVLNNYKLKFNHGMASSLDVTQANSNFLEAQGNYLNAMFDVMNAKVQLEKLLTNLSNL